MINEIVAVTFFTKKTNIYQKNYSERVTKLEQSLQEFNIPLIKYEIRDIWKITSHSLFRLNMFYPIGVGGWFWKSSIIIDQIKKNKSRYILYVDSDCVIREDPRKYIVKSLRNHSIAAFSQSLSIYDWTSSRCLKLMNLDSNLHYNNMWTAGILAIKNNNTALQYMSAWNLNMKDPRKLINQVTFNSQKNHRFDQSIFSILVAKGTIDCKELSGGFFSLGQERTVDSIEKSWIYTGEISNRNDKIIYSRERNKNRFLYYGNKLLQVAYFLFIWPIHLALSKELK